MQEAKLVPSGTIYTSIRDAAVTSAIAYDVTRLFLGPLSPTPRGIDRVDLMLANHFFRDPDSRHVGILPTPWGVRAFEAPRIRRGLRQLEQLWTEHGEATEDRVWDELRSRLVGGPGRDTSRARPLSPFTRARRLGAGLRATGVSLGRSVLRAVPEGAVYLNVGQIGLAVPRFLRWLDLRRDVVAVFMLHDVIPLENPEFVSPPSVRHHATMVASTARHADGLIVTTEHSRSTVTGALARLGRSGIDTHADGLPLPGAFNGSVAPHPDLAGLTYFVVCGSIEPRKNHALLHRVWIALASRFGHRMPHLIIVGAPGWNSGSLLDQLQNCTMTRHHIHPVSGLSSPALKQLLAGAAGLLMPSWNEGFGLPVIEGNALAVPTIASDIPAHREVANSQTCLLDPGDADAWTDVIASWCDNGPPVVTSTRKFAGVEAWCSGVEEFLDRCAGNTAAKPGGRRPYLPLVPAGPRPMATPIPGS